MDPKNPLAAILGTPGFGAPGQYADPQSQQLAQTPQGQQQLQYQQGLAQLQGLSQTINQKHAELTQLMQHHSNLRGKLGV